MGRKATKPRTIFMIKLVELLAAKGVVAVRFYGGRTSPDGIRITYQIPHLTTKTILTVDVSGRAERQKFPPYKENWYSSSIRYNESGTYTRYGHVFDHLLWPHELCEFICKRLLPQSL